MRRVGSLVTYSNNYLLCPRQYAPLMGSVMLSATRTYTPCLNAKSDILRRVDGA